MVNLSDLELDLRALSHSERAVEVIKTFCACIPRTADRLAILNVENALVRRPIEPALVRSIGFNTDDDAFDLLQGDIVRTDAAFSFGERITGNPKYAVLNASCDLVRGRARSSMLLRISDLLVSDNHSKEKLSQLAKFSRKDSMYLPPCRETPAP
jgi:hypothetical protein